MAYDDINAVLLLINIGPVKVLPESCLNPGPLLVELLYRKYTLIEHTYCYELTNPCGKHYHEET